MNIRNISFETWSRNHEDNHESKWCREVYPWQVFREVSYETNLIGRPQILRVNGVPYETTIIRYFIGDNNRGNFQIHLKSAIHDERDRWEHRSWNDIFRLVASQDGHFITLYTEKLDPSKKLITSFMRGNLGEVVLERSKPVSALLFRSLVSYGAEEILGA